VTYLMVIFAAYLAGSIPSAIIVGKLWKGIDVRQHGSGNIGATNVFRVLGAGPGAVVLCLDALKGVIGVYFGMVWLGGGWGPVLGGLIAVAGHNWPIWLSFKGGRGVATGLGVILMLVPKITVIVTCVFALVVYFTRYVSLGSIIAALSVPLLMLLFHETLPVLIFGLVASSFVVIRHRANIGRLLNGTELKISWGKESSSDAEKR